MVLAENQRKENPISSFRSLLPSVSKAASISHSKAIYSAATLKALKALRPHVSPTRRSRRCPRNWVSMARKPSQKP